MLTFVPPHPDTHSSFSVPSFLGRDHSPSISLSPLLSVKPPVPWSGSRRDTGSGWGPDFETGFKQAWELLGRVGEVNDGGCVCVLRRRREGGSVGKHSGGCCCFPLSGLEVNWRVVRASQAAGGESDGVWFQPPQKNGRRGGRRLIEVREMVQFDMGGKKKSGRAKGKCAAYPL